jgi:hypothetical protein
MQTELLGLLAVERRKKALSLVKLEPVQFWVKGRFAGLWKPFEEQCDFLSTSQTPRRKRVARKLEVELRDAGCSLDPKRFIKLLEERHVAMHPEWTVDDLVCHPDQAKTYCEQIRSEVGAPVPDHVILRRLMNARKAH